MKPYDFEHLCRVTIGTAVREYIQKGGKINQLAYKADLNHRTIAKLAYNETKHPRFSTVASTLAALGYELELRSGKETEAEAPPTSVDSGRRTRHLLRRVK